MKYLLFKYLIKIFIENFLIFNLGMGKASLSYTSMSEPKTETNEQSDLRRRSHSPEYARNNDSKQKVSLRIALEMTIIPAQPIPLT